MIGPIQDTSEETFLALITRIRITAIMLTKLISLQYLLKLIAELTLYIRRYTDNSQLFNTKTAFSKITYLGLQSSVKQSRS